MNRQIQKKKLHSFSVRVCSTLNRKWLVFFAIFLATAELRAQTWKAGVGNWFVGENWTPPTVPTAISIVTVANGGTAQVVGATASASDLTIGSTSTVLVGANGTLNVNTALVNSGNIASTANGVSLLAAGSVTNNAGGSIQGSLTAPVQFPFAGGVTVSTGTVTNAGLISGENGVVFTGAGQ
jgi:hypothetical protein